MLTIAPSTKRVIVAYTVIVAILLGLLWFSLQQTGTPVEQTSGIVEAVTFSSSQDRPGTQTAIVRRPDGTLLQAQVPPNATVRSGDKVDVVGYQQFFSATRTYEIVLDAK